MDSQTVLSMTAERKVSACSGDPNFNLAAWRWEEEVEGREDKEEEEREKDKKNQGEKEE